MKGVTFHKIYTFVSPAALLGTRILLQARNLLSCVLPPFIIPIKVTSVTSNTMSVLCLFLNFLHIPCTHLCLATFAECYTWWSSMLWQESFIYLLWWTFRLLKMLPWILLVVLVFWWIYVKILLSIYLETVKVYLYVQH